MLERETCSINCAYTETTFLSSHIRTIVCIKLVTSACRFCYIISLYNDSSLKKVHSLEPGSPKQETIINSDSPARVSVVAQTH